MFKNPDHKVIKDLAKNMLFKMTTCPDGLQKVCNESIPVAEFRNGLYTPNDRPPVSVYVCLDGQFWRFTKGRKFWMQV